MRDGAPLNPWLRQLLESIFPKVGVCGSGRIGTYSLVPSRNMSLQRGAPVYACVEDWGEVYSVDCPYCGDKRQRLYFSHMLGCHIQAKRRVCFSRWLWKCWNNDCHRQPEMRKWWQSIQLPEQDLQELYKRVGASPKAASFRAYVPEIDLPSGCTWLSDPRNPGFVREYVESRSYSVEDLERQYFVRFAPAGTIYFHDEKGVEPDRCMVEDRLLIPIIQRRRLISWQARRFFDNPQYKGQKYLNMPGSKKEEWLYNMDVALMHDDIVIHEGAADVWRTGANAVALGGSTMSSQQRERMKTLWADDGQAVVMLDSAADDPEAPRHAAAIVTELNDCKVFPRGAVAAQLPAGDPGDNELVTIKHCEAEARKQLNNPSKWRTGT